MYCQLSYVGNYVLSVILLTLPEQLSSPSVVFSGVRVTRSLVLCVCFGDRCLSLSPFSFGHCVVCSSSIHFGLFKLFLFILKTDNYHFELSIQSAMGKPCRVSPTPSCYLYQNRQNLLSCSIIKLLLHHIYKHITTVNSTTHHRHASCQVSVDLACFNIITLMISDRIFMTFSQGFENGLPKLTNCNDYNSCT